MCDSPAHIHILQLALIDLASMSINSIVGMEQWNSLAVPHMNLPETSGYVLWLSRAFAAPTHSTAATLLFILALT